MLMLVLSVCVALWAPSRRGFSRARARVSVYGLRVFRERAYTQDCARARVFAARICEMCIIASVCVCVCRRRGPAERVHAHAAAVRHSKTCFDVAQCAYNTRRTPRVCECECTTRRMNSRPFYIFM